jgi:hypothetical protein
MVDNRKDRVAVKKELNERKADLTTKKAELEKPAGNNASAKVKEYYDELERIEDEIKEAEVTAKKEGWRVREFADPVAGSSFLSLTLLALLARPQSTNTSRSQLGIACGLSTSARTRMIMFTTS